MKGELSGLALKNLGQKYLILIARNSAIGKIKYVGISNDRLNSFFTSPTTQISYHTKKYGY